VSFKLFVRQIQDEDVISSRRWRQLSGHSRTGHWGELTFVFSSR